MEVAIIDYKSGNIRSVKFALERIGINAVLSDDPEVIAKADKVIFPGVGEAASAMEQLILRKFDVLIPSLRQPVLGICLGMQLMCRHSEESNTNCLGIFEHDVKLFKGEEKVPQMGWNNIATLSPSLFTGIEEGSYMYFVHSYYAELGKNTIAQTNYIFPYSSALQKNNFYGVQFHPEKSGEAGQRILENFIKL